ncbi:MAG: methylated-DNA--[protein]-cysteine S-methyltransferase [Gammaproteobacteria bacterium]|nr:methylated-DNA--[protein]-cysteine S-methyltransferase [Gammaproteobacteria bacterium]
MKMKKNNLMISIASMTLSEYRNAGKNLVIDYGYYHSPFGECFIANADSGICTLAFSDTKAESTLIENEFKQLWSEATIKRNDAQIKQLAEIIFSENKNASLKLLLRGSAFQLKVWKALLSVPTAHLKSYQEIAITIQQPTAVRAVASAIAKNNIAYLVPCHRVIRKNGDIGQYRWHAHRKQALIAWEAS